MNHDLTDKELLAYKGEAAFRVLYDRYWEPLYRKALTRLGNDADAQDAVQEVFVSCWRNRARIEVQDSLAPYLFAALRLWVIRKVTREAKRGQVLPLDIRELEALHTAPEEPLRYKELEALVHGEVAEMPGRMQQVFRMSRLEHQNIKEIASELQLSEQTVKNTLTSALKRLRTRLSHLSSWLGSFL